MSDRNIPTEKDLVAHCIDAQAFYSEKPGLHGPGTAIDLYYVCQLLAKRVAALEAKTALKETQ